MIKVSVITVSYNSEKTIEDTIASVKSQSYKLIEHVFVDGNSLDNTTNLIKQNLSKNSLFISEKDDGLYHAMNKGISIATGEIIFILNSDDIFNDNLVIEKVVKIFTENESIELVYGDLIITKLNKIVRKWIAGDFKYHSFLNGWCPGHPSVVIKKKAYEKYGVFDLDYKYAADLELMFRFLDKNKCKYHYLNEILVNMRAGGKSNKNLINVIKQNIENIKIFKNCNNFNFIKFFLSKFKHRYKQLNR